MKEIRNSLRKKGISVSIKTGNRYNQGQYEFNSLQTRTLCGLGYLGKYGKVTVICTVTATYRTTLQKTEATENVGKSSGDRNNNIQGDMPYTGSLYTGLTALSRHIWELYYTNRQIVLIPQNIPTYIKASVWHSDHWNFTGNLAIHWISLQEGIPRDSLFIVCSWRMIQRLLEMVL